MDAIQEYIGVHPRPLIFIYYFFSENMHINRHFIVVGSKFTISFPVKNFSAVTRDHWEKETVSGQSKFSNDQTQSSLHVSRN